MRIGIDIADVDEFDALGASSRFCTLVYTPAELSGANSREGRRRSEYLAGRFAGKEAVVKLLGTGFSHGSWWRDVEIVADELGAPAVRLHRGAAELAEALGLDTIAMSISHKGPWAVAVAAGGPGTGSPAGGPDAPLAAVVRAAPASSL
jgi:holo-[acyl-carrier protein] synthase